MFRPSCFFKVYKSKLTCASPLRWRAPLLRSIDPFGNTRQFSVDRHIQQEDVAEDATSSQDERHSRQSDGISGLGDQRQITITRQFSPIDSEIPLPIDALGKRAAIRVMRERPPPLEEHAIDNAAASEGEGYEELFQGVVEEKGKFSGAEAVKNIEEIRRTFNERTSTLQGISSNDCQLAAQTLLEGFTVEQLHFYIQSQSWGSTGESDNLEGLYSGSSYKRSRWFVGESEFPGGAQRRLKPDFISKLDSDFPILKTPQAHSVSSQHTKKSKMVDVILRYCWGYRVSEEKAELGTVDFEMKAMVLGVLLMNNDKTFEKISQTYGVNINVAPTLGLTRITGNYETCELASRAVAASINDVKVERIALNSLGEWKSYVSKARPLWSYVGRLTNTNIWSEVEGAVDVFFMESESSVLRQVQRLLNQIQEHFASKPGHVFLCPRTIAPILVPIQPDEGFNFCERTETWFRWRDRDFSAKRKSSGTLDQLTMPPAGASDIEDLRNKFRNQFTSVESRYWESRPSQTVSAQFGSIVHAPSNFAKLEHNLHRLAKSKEDKEGIQKSIFKQLTRSPRALATMFPNMLTAMNELISNAPTLSNYIRIVLEPESPSFPVLELDIALNNRSKTTELGSARLIYHTDAQDLLLPLHPVDIRFISRTMFTSKPRDLDPVLLSFLSNSNLDVWGNDMLSTPPDLALEFPLSIHSLGQSSSTSIVKYSFLRLSVCSDLEGLCQGFPLILSTAEAGKSLGRKQMLHLDLDVNTNDEEESNTPPAEDQEPMSRWDTEFLLWYGVVKNVMGRILF